MKPEGSHLDLADASYLAAITLAGAVARALVRGLPEGWRLRLEAAGPPALKSGWLWVHAVSVGELLLAEGVLGRWREEGHRIHVTTGTVAGLELLQRRLPGWDQGSGRITGGAFPVDDGWGLAPFFVRPPGAFISLETEIWPNLLRELERRGIPRIIVNGRLTERSLSRGGLWLGRAARRLTLVAARDAASAEAFRALGAPQVVLGGNLKADLPAPKPLHAGWAHLRQAWADCPVIVAGNTVEGEEAMVVAAWLQARVNRPTLRLILAPRQPRRFQEVADWMAGQGLRVRRASQPWPADAAPWADTDLLLLDTLGELASAYAEATLALVAGGWAWHGGHNPLEPVRFGVPTVIGPGFANFQDLVLPLQAAGLVRVVETEVLAARIQDILDHSPMRPAESTQSVDYPEGLMGALDTTCDFLKPVLPHPRYVF